MEEDPRRLQEAAQETVKKHGTVRPGEEFLINLLDIVHRTPEPGPWEEGDNIPWDEPAFSRRMLQEHLSQEHDAASRRAEKIDQHVRWIHEELLQSRPGRILDLCCGPGLYTHRLAGLGHECVGIDFSPASIGYAAEHVPESGRCTYRHEDVRAAAFGNGFDLVMLVFGQLNVFRPTEAEAILRGACGALADGGRLLLEVAVRESHAKPGTTWYATPSGLFSDEPHLCLEESLSDEATATTTTRFYIVDAATGRVSHHALTHKAYTDQEYEQLLTGAGFGTIRLLPSLGGPADAPREDFIAIVAGK